MEKENKKRKKKRKGEAGERKGKTKEKERTNKIKKGKKGKKENMKKEKKNMERAKKKGKSQKEGKEDGREGKRRGGGKKEGGRKEGERGRKEGVRGRRGRKDGRRGLCVLVLCRGALVCDCPLVRAGDTEKSRVLTLSGPAPPFLEGVTFIVSCGKNSQRSSPCESRARCPSLLLSLRVALFPDRTADVCQVSTCVSAQGSHSPKAANSTGAG